ncbi:MAG TPA: tRNA pseudouridine(55) synthase TruB [Polyangiaceae bacterium]
MTTDGRILIVNKPIGPTSHDVVAQARRLFKTRAVGHAGTLDPMASGVLLILIEEATKLSSALTLDHKSYRATIRFGTSTDSHDALGIPVETREVPRGWLGRKQLDVALDVERHRTLQTPPSISAIKQQGKTAYSRHRQGETVELSARSVHVLDLSLLEATDESVELSITVTKGYYVRALARDLGASLGMPSHLSSLCRTSSGCFTIEEAACWPCHEPPPCLTMADVARRSMPTRVLSSDGIRRARCGLTLLPEHFDNFAALANAVPNDAVEMWLDAMDHAIALGVAQSDGTFRVARGFRPAD